MEQFFELLFKYRFFYFREGDLRFLSGPSGWQIVLGVGVLAALVVLLYRRRPRSSDAISWLLPGLRLALLVVFALMLLRPALVISTLVPRENLLALVVDTSRSMGLADGDTPRGQPVVDLLDPDSDFIAGLEENFHLRYIAFDSSARSVDGLEGVDWTGEQTNIGAALQGVLARSRNLPLGGVVVFTDGSDNSFGDSRDTIAELKARGVPVHTVGVGPEALVRDVELTQVSAPRRLMPETVAVARVTLRQAGFGGSRGRLEVREGSRLVTAEEVHLDSDSDLTTVEVTLKPATEGLKDYTFTFLPLNGEENERNNSRRALVEVRDTTPRILYVEGHPRWEYKFIRQAVADDDFLRLETLLRTALNKFYRQGIEEETTLAAGFPTTREELFKYRALVIGNLEAAFFSYAQMEMIRDFVGRRGGGLIMLGGSTAFSDGGYRNTPIEEVLPVWLAGEGSQEPPRQSQFYRQNLARVELTQHGSVHPVLQLAPEGDSEPGRIWRELPELTDYNEVRGPKSGATVLAQASEAGGGTALPVFVSQRYGRGLGLALLTSSSWHWQMLADAEDQSHETFWRQLFRWLVSNAGEEVSVEAERETYSRGEPVRIRAEVNNDTFTRVNDARVEAEITTPAGTVATIPLQWNVREDGVYTGDWVTSEDGLHRIRVTAAAGSAEEAASYGQATSYFTTSTGGREYFDAVQKRGYLESLAADTGGRYYPLSEAARLPSEIVHTPTQSSVVEVRELWNMPFNFLLIAALLCGEWILRKRWGAI